MLLRYLNYRLRSLVRGVSSILYCAAQDRGFASFSSGILLVPAQQCALELCVPGTCELSHRITKHLRHIVVTRVLCQRKRCRRYI